jgi:hypothetical protein
MMHPTNPLVETQRPGWCVLEERAQEGRDASRTWVVMAGTTKGGRRVFSLHADRSSALVYFDLDLAKADATEVGEGIVTTIPRHNGHCVEWSEVWCAPPKPLVTPWG